MRDLMTRLWREVFGEPPPLADDAQLLGQILIENLPAAPPYQPVDFRMIHRRTGTDHTADKPQSEDDQALRA